jgi:hypothetical protein
MEKYQIHFCTVERNEQAVKMSYFVVKFTGDRSVDGQFCVVLFHVTCDVKSVWKIPLQVCQSNNLITAKYLHTCLFPSADH